MGSSVQRFIIVVIFPLVIAVSSFFSQSLVKQVSAACSGTVPCGDEGYFCSGDSTTSCDNPGEDCKYNNGTCQWLCNLTLNPDHNRCDNLSETSCNSVTAADCAEGCNTDPEPSCTWGTATAPPSEECPYGGTCKTACSESEQGNGSCVITTANYCCIPLNSFTCWAGDITIVPNPKTADPGDEITYTATFADYSRGGLD